MAKIPLGIKVVQAIFDKFNSKCLERNTCFRLTIILLTYFAFVVNRMCRKIVSVVETRYQTQCNYEFFKVHGGIHDYDQCIRKQQEISEKHGELDSAFLFSYAIGMFLCALIMDKINLRYFISFGLILSALLSVLMGLGKIINVQTMDYYIFIQILMGFAQSTTWPSIVKIMSNWFAKSKRGRIFGLWCSNTPVGNIIGALIAGLYVDTDWSLSFIVPGIITAIFAIVLLLFLLPEPSDVDVPLYGREDTEELSKSTYERNIEVAQSASEKTFLLNNVENNVTFFEAFKVPGVIEFSLCLFFIKLINVTFLYWLPSFIKLTTNETSSASANISTFLDVGGIFGNIITGYLADVTGKSATICSGLMGLSIPLLYIYQNLTINALIGISSNIILLIVLGVLIVGPNFLITTVVCTELGSNVNGKSLTTVIAIMDGVGCLGGAVGPLLAGFIQWQHVFFMLMFSSLLSVLFLLRLTIKDFRN